MIGHSQEMVVVRSHFNGTMLTEVAFQRSDGSFGAYCDAARLLPNQDTGNASYGSFAVLHSELPLLLLNFLADRSELYALEDFSQCSGDVFGNPKVFHHQWHCPSCQKDVEKLTSDISAKVYCPECGSAVDSEETSHMWSGPEDPLLIELWEELPIADKA